MSGREEMLERIRAALGRSDRRPHAERDSLPDLGRVLPPIPPEKLIDHFEAELRNVAGVPSRAASVAELQQILLSILPPPAAGSPLVLSRNPLLSQLGLVQKLKALSYSVTCWPAEGSAPADGWAEFRRQCFSAPAGITGVDFALAESGTLVLSSATEGSQLASVAPPIHVALYTRSQVVESLEEVLRELPRMESGSRELRGRSVVFITGTSRTADIEQISIRGVHGPTQLHAILVEESCYT